MHVEFVENEGIQILISKKLIFGNPMIIAQICIPQKKRKFLLSKIRLFLSHSRNRGFQMPISEMLLFQYPMITAQI